MKYTINFDPNPSKEDTQILGDGLIAYAKRMKNQKPIEIFGYFVRDESNHIIGGCTGCMYYGCFYIDYLWLDESIRGKGVGRELMQLSENLARDKHCLFMTVNTMDWEALDFYQKFGFVLEFERKGYANNSTFYFLRKNITSSAEQV